MYTRARVCVCVCISFRTFDESASSIENTKRVSCQRFNREYLRQMAGREQHTSVITFADLSRVSSRRESFFHHPDIFFSALARGFFSINLGDFSFAGREESDTDDQLLGDTDLDGPSPEMERLGVRGDPSDSCSLQSRLEAGHDSVQQVSDDSVDKKKKLQWSTKTDTSNENGKGKEGSSICFRGRVSSR